SLVAGLTTGEMLKPGQRVQVGQAEGTVVRHDLNATVLTTSTGEVAIPNQVFTHEQFTVLATGNGQRQPVAAGVGTGPPSAAAQPAPAHRARPERRQRRPHGRVTPEL